MIFLVQHQTGIIFCSCILISILSIDILYLMGVAKKKIIGIIVIVVIISIGIFFFTNNDNKNILQNSLGLNQTRACPPSFSPTMEAGPYYDGELLDSHLHLPTASKAVSEASIKVGQPTPAWDSELDLKYLDCLLGREGTSRVYGFHLLTKFSVNAEVNKAKEIEKQYPGMIVHFLMPTMINSVIDPSVSSIKKALEENPGLFSGMGELKMFDGKEPDDPYVLALLDLAREYNLIVMMHPFNHHKADVEKIVQRYNDVIFIFHGMDHISEGGNAPVIDNREWLKELIANNDNVYYSIRGNFPTYGWLKRHMGTAVPKEELLPHLKSKLSESVERGVSWSKDVIEAYPERFLYETDRQFRPHYDKEISALIEEYSRAFIGRLDPSVQERFAHKNAEKLLKTR